MTKKLSALVVVLVGLAAAACVPNERSQAQQVAAELALAVPAPAGKPGAPIDHLLEAHNSYLMEASKPGLRTPRALECSDMMIMSRKQIARADRR